MKLFILTHCAAEENYTPQVFKTREEAQNEMNKTVDNLVYERDLDGDLISQYTDNFEIYDDRAEIVYPDDTYDCLEIFEVEVAL